jgi:hypothetical protein
LCIGPSIRSSFIVRCQAEKIDPDKALADFLNENTDPDTFWSKVKTNLQAGKVRMVFVADIIPPELHRIVEFLNQQMDPAEVLALEIKQYVSGETIALSCDIIGMTSEAGQKKGRVIRNWDAASFFQSVAEKCQTATAEAISRIYDWAGASQAVSWGKGTKAGGFGVCDRESGSAVLWTYDNGQVVVALSNLAQLPPFQEAEKRLAFVQKLNAISGIAIPEDNFDSVGWPSFQLKGLPAADGTNQLLEVLAWAFEEVKNMRVLASQ